MMYGYGYSWPLSWPMMIGMMLFWILIIGLIIWGIIEIIKRTQGSQRTFASSSKPEEVVKLRYAKGEISKKQYEEMLKELKK